jgi:hypothetical protein
MPGFDALEDRNERWIEDETENRFNVPERNVDSDKQMEG